MSMAGVLALEAAAYGQSLADVARQEEERRRATSTQVRVYTNEDLGKASQPAPIATTVAAAKPDATASKADAGKVESTEAAAEAPKAEVNEHRNEQHWRERSRSYRERLDKLRADVAAIQSQIDALQAAAQTPAVLSDLRIAEKDLIKFKNQMAFIQKEWSQIELLAREAKVPPAWLQ
jgi:hypothetical protein